MATRKARKSVPLVAGRKSSASWYRAAWALILLAAPALAGEGDGTCPAYPAEQRAKVQAALARDRAFLSLPLRSRGGARRYQSLSVNAPVPRGAPQRINFIDDEIFAGIAAAGIEPAPLTTDAEFLRRVTLDLTGRIPTREQAEAFEADESTNKRTALIDSLIGSGPFVDYWTLFFGNKFEVGSNYYNFIGIPGRNLFHQYLRDFIAQDRPYDQVARELITAAGDSHQLGPPNFAVRATQIGDPVQDTWDVLANRVTTQFLGVQTQCVACHDGRRHLEDINLYLAGRKRAEFWQMSAFFSRLEMIEALADAYGQQAKFFVHDRSEGFYHGITPPGNPGPRPPRQPGPYTPAYFLTGEEPASGQWRQELARILIADRQFARATVNYLWAHFFRIGIVDPPDAWDLARIDPDNPPPPPWTLQASHPALLEDLTDRFIDGGYRLRPIIRLLAESNAYQLSSSYPGTWKPEYTRLFAKHFPRRLMAEEIYDAVAEATLTRTPMFLDGFDEPLQYAVQLPDTTEPRTNYPVNSFLEQFGRGNWWQQDRSDQTSLTQTLFLMNSFQMNFRLFGNAFGNAANRVARLSAADITDAEAVRRLFVATLSREPTNSELAIALAANRSNRQIWLSDLQWALLNKTEFLFNR